MVLSSQYCHGTFMRMRNELIGTVTAPVFKNSSCNWRDDPANGAKICDVRAIYTFCENYNEAQYEAFCTIHDLLVRMTSSDDVILVGFPLLTQFNVDLLCVLSNLFRKVRKNFPF